MKNTILKTVFSSLLLLGTSSICHAKPEHRISLGAGLISYSYLDEIFDENSEIDICLPDFSEDKIAGVTTDEFAWRELQTLPITINLHYECTLGKHFGVGLCIGYDYQRMSLDIDKYTYTGEVAFHDEILGDITHEDYNYRNESGELTRHKIYIMPEATFYYFKKEHVSMYGKLAAGVSFTKIKRENVNEETRGTKLNDHTLSFQVSPVGLEIGNKNICGFMEYGFGTQGLAQFGVKHTFQKKGKGSAE